MNQIKIPLILQQMNQIFINNGFEAFLVGGAVRDIIRNKKASDWDLATNARPEDVIHIFKKVIPTGISHGTVTVHFMNKEIEVTTYRLEKDYSDGRHPNSITYTSDIEEDLSRRDFTMNAIAASLTDGFIKDPFHGQEDIKKKVIRTVGNADARFSEDGLRPVRAIRFAAQTGFTLSKETLDAIPRALEVTNKISKERFRDEFCKLICSPIPSIGLKLLETTGILNLFLPELINCRNVIQADERSFHHFDVLDHLYYACDGASWIENLRGEQNSNLYVRLAALFHDCGKPSVKKTEYKSLDVLQPEKLSKIYTFYNHERISAKITESIMERLKFSKLEIKYTCHLIQQHMFFYEPTWTDGAVRRFFSRITTQDITIPKGKNVLNDLFDLRISDEYGMMCKPITLSNSMLTQNLTELLTRINQVTYHNEAITLKDLAINGTDLQAIGIPSGKKIGQILKMLLETVLDDPEQNKKETLLNIAQKYSATF